MSKIIKSRNTKINFFLFFLLPYTSTFSDQCGCQKNIALALPRAHVFDGTKNSNIVI